LSFLVWPPPFGLFQTCPSPFAKMGFSKPWQFTSPPPPPPPIIPRGGPKIGGWETKKTKKYGFFFLFLAQPMPPRLLTHQRGPGPCPRHPPPLGKGLPRTFIFFQFPGPWSPRSARRPTICFVFFFFVTKMQKMGPPPPAPPNQSNFFLAEPSPGFFPPAPDRKKPPSSLPPPPPPPHKGPTR